MNGAVESYTYDLGDKMLTAGAKSYTYDAAGRTVGINAPGGTTTLTYDYESRVTAISGPGINETHTYNGLDTRVGTVQGGVSRTFVRDGSYVTDPVLRDGQATYTPGVSERRGGVSTWSHSGLKNADAQTTSVGAIAATRVYDAFGAELSATGTWKGPFGYAGGFGYQEDSSGLKLLGHRYYDPTTGRFLSRDPIKDGRNWYVYADSDPVRLSDPTGLFVVSPVVIGVAVLSVVALGISIHKLGTMAEKARENRQEEERRFGRRGDNSSEEGKMMGPNTIDGTREAEERSERVREGIEELRQIMLEEVRANYIHGPILRSVGASMKFIRISELSDRTGLTDGEVLIELYQGVRSAVE